MKIPAGFERSPVWRGAYRKGYEAGAAGLGLDACPYEDKRKDCGRLTWSRAFRSCWRDGWGAGRQERLGLAPAAPTTDDGQMFVLALANKVCQHLPEGWQLDLCMERGAAWVQLSNPDGDGVCLPDAADKSLEQQVNDALCVARGW